MATVLPRDCLVIIPKSLNSKIESKAKGTGYTVHAAWGGTKLEEKNGEKWGVGERRAHKQSLM